MLLKSGLVPFTRFFFLTANGDKPYKQRLTELRTAAANRTVGIVPEKLREHLDNKKLSHRIFFILWCCRVFLCNKVPANEQSVLPGLIAWEKHSHAHMRSRFNALTGIELCLSMGARSDTNRLHPIADTTVRWHSSEKKKTGGEGGLVRRLDKRESEIQKKQKRVRRQWARPSRWTEKIVRSD